jgi:hypothetical protein
MPLCRLCGGRSQPEQRAALREYTEQAAREGSIESPWSRLVAGMVLGSEAFARKLCQKMRVNRREQAQAKKLEERADWQVIVAALERVKGEGWQQFSQRHGDWGRDAALWLGRRVGRLRLAQLGELVGGLDYAAVGQALARFGRRLEREPSLRRSISGVQARLSNVEM